MEVNTAPAYNGASTLESTSSTIESGVHPRRRAATEDKSLPYCMLRSFSADTVTSL